MRPAQCPTTPMPMPIPFSSVRIPGLRRSNAASRRTCRCREPGPGRRRLELIGSWGIKAYGNLMPRLNTANWTARRVAVGATGARPACGRTCSPRLLPGNGNGIGNAASSLQVNATGLIANHRSEVPDPPSIVAAFDRRNGSRTSTMAANTKRKGSWRSADRDSRAYSSQPRTYDSSNRKTLG